MTTYSSRWSALVVCVKWINAIHSFIHWKVWITIIHWSTKDKAGISAEWIALLWNFFGAGKLKLELSQSHENYCPSQQNWISWLLFSFGKHCMHSILIKRLKMGKHRKPSGKSVFEVNVPKQTPFFWGCLCSLRDGFPFANQITIYWKTNKRLKTNKIYQTYDLLRTSKTKQFEEKKEKKFSQNALLQVFYG